MRTERTSFPNGARVIPAIVCEPSSIQRGALLVHGIFSEKDEDGRFIRLASRLGENATASLRFDFIGHGESQESSEEFTVAAALADFQIAAQEYATRFASVPRSLVASSFGGSIVLLAAQAGLLSALGIDRIVLLNPVTDYRSSFLEPFGEQMQEIFTPEALAQIRSKGAAEVADGFVLSLAVLLEFALLDPGRGFEKLDAPTLVLQGDKDTAVAHDVVKRHASSSSIARFETIEDAAHAFVEPKHEERVFSAVVDFLAPLSGSAMESH